MNPPVPYYEDEVVTLYHGDCLDVLPTLEPESVTLLWTDPPYGHNNHDGDLNANLNKHRGIENKPIANDDADGMRSVVDGMLLASLPALRSDCCCCCCCGGGGGGRRPTFAWLAERMNREGLDFFHSVIWDKVNPGLGWRYRRQHEMVMISHKTGGKLAWGDEEVKAVPNIIPVYPPRNRLHPNEKPEKLVSGFIQRHTKPGDLVLDPFAGSGTTLRVAKDLGRRAIGIELDEDYCKVAVDRLAQGVLSFGAEAA
jgi:site-specific DNA-methyltransferase (adenine-specific)